MDFKQGKQTLYLAIPIIFAHIGQMLLHAIDSVMLGHIGSIDLASAAFAGNIINIFLLFSIGIGTAVRVLIANCSGSNNTDQEKNYLILGIGISLAFASLFIAFIFFGKSFLIMLNQPIEVIKLSKDYMNFLAISLLPFLSYRCLRVYAEAKNKSWIPFKVLIGGLFLNTLLNWIMIFGHLGFPRLEIYGAGLATLITRIMMLISLVLLLKYDKDIQFKLTLKNFRFSIASIRNILRLIFPFTIQQMSEWGFFILLGIIAGWSGTLALASHHIAYNFLTILFSIPLSISAVISIQVSKYLGENNLPLCRKTSINGIILSAMIMFPLCILFFPLRKYLPFIFTHDLFVTQLTSTILIFMCPVLFFDSMQCLTMGALRGMHDTKIPTIYVFICYWLVGLPLIYFLTITLRYGILGVWSGLLITLFIVFIILYHRLLKVHGLQKQMGLRSQVKDQSFD